jgi:YggT family protein
MFIFGNFLIAAARILDVVLTAYMWIIIIRAILSWVNPDPYNPIVRVLYQITEPVLNRVRALIPLRGMGIDLSPMIVLLAIIFLQNFLVPSLIELAASFR